MPSLKSVTAGGDDWHEDVADQSFKDFAERFPRKLYWFLKNGYRPHEWQAAFHSAANGERLCRFRHLVAGRRGGKTLSAAEDVVFYALHPSDFHMDFHGRVDDRPLWIWVLAKDHEVGFPARRAVLDVLREAGLRVNKDFKHNKTEKIIEFDDGTLLQFKTADDPQSLRGAGLDILWIDEAAFIPTDEAFGVVRPALADKLGAVITTTTPRGKNWFFDEFWNEAAMSSPAQFTVEYTSIDNPYFRQDEWESEKRRMHPILFKQEYMAAFDALTGVELQGDWLHYYSIGDPGVDEIRLPMTEGKFVGKKYMAVDPAVSLSDSADYFAMAIIGLAPDNENVYLLDTFKDRLAFPDQLTKIREWFLKYRPEFIGIESNAYQRALAQQAARMPGLPPIVEIISKGKKWERIMSMAPVFQYKKVRIHKAHGDFIEEWVNYDSTAKNSKDDLLDAVEIALRSAGVLLPALDPAVELPTGYATMEDEARAQVLSASKKTERYDLELGSEA